MNNRSSWKMKRTAVIFVATAYLAIWLFVWWINWDNL